MDVVMTKVNNFKVVNKRGATPLNPYKSFVSQTHGMRHNLAWVDACTKGEAQITEHIFSFTQQTTTEHLLEQRHSLR